MSRQIVCSFFYLSRMMISLIKYTDEVPFSPRPNKKSEYSNFSECTSVFLARTVRTVISMNFILLFIMVLFRCTNNDGSMLQYFYRKLKG